VLQVEQATGLAHNEQLSVHICAEHPNWTGFKKNPGVQTEQTGEVKLPETQFVRFPYNVVLQIPLDHIL